MNQKLKHINNTIARRVQKATDRWAARYWHSFPFGNEMKAPPDVYLSLWEKEKQAPYPEIDEFEKKTGFSIDPEWLHNLALHTQIVIKTSPLCYQHGRVLYSTLRRYIQSNTAASITIFETGTARGFSSVVMAKALADEKKPGKIITFDVLPHHVSMYWNCIDDKNGPQTRAQLLSPWSEIANSYITFIEGCSRINLPKIQPGRINFAFLDGAHGYNDVMFEFETVAAKQTAGDVIVFDDYNADLFPGVVKGVDTGCQTLGYSKEIIHGRGNRHYVIATKNA
jgi:predicted O-methyltransferase YrrM